MSIQSIILKTNTLIVVFCLLLFISQPAYSIEKESFYKEKIILSPKDSTETKGLYFTDFTIDFADYFLINRKSQSIIINDYYMAFYTGEHSNSKINLAELRNPLMLLQFIFILVVALLILIYSFLFQLLFALAAISCLILFLVNWNKAKENSE